MADLTHTLLLALSLLPQYHPHLISLSQRPRFLSAMQAYLSHPDASIRRLGMLVAEIVSQMTIEERGDVPEYSEKDEIEDLKAGLEGEGDAKSRPSPRGARRLNFGAGMWEGEGEGREEARWLRARVGVKDGDAIIPEALGDEEESAWLLGWTQTHAEATTLLPDITDEAPKRSQSGPKAKPARPKAPKAAPKIIMLDEEQQQDPLEGYDAPSPSSSRSASPTPSYLEEVAADPSLALDAAGKKKVSRPVYISQLLALVKEREKPECIEMALRFGESLIRAKRNFGGELGEWSPRCTRCLAKQEESRD